VRVATYEGGSVESGNWAEWVGAVGTVLAFGGAFAFGIGEVKSRRRAEQDDVARQARLIVLSEPAMGESRQIDELGLFVSVTNYSDAPIHDVVVVLPMQRGEAPIIEGQTTFAHVGPGERQEAGYQPPMGPGDLCSLAPIVWFLDANGRRWRRTPDDPLPMRVLDYIPPGLPTEVVDRIRRDRRIRWGRHRMR
jgi:hypothetical protein